MWPFIRPPLPSPATAGVLPAKTPAACSRMPTTAPADLNVAIYPAPASLACNGSDLARKTDGVFQRFPPPAPRAVKFKATDTSLQTAGPPREIPIGKIQQPVATAPLDSDF